LKNWYNCTCLYNPTGIKANKFIPHILIDTKRTSELAKRGHCKSLLNALRIIGVSIRVIPYFSIPLIHDTYPGNLNDAVEFARMVNRLKNRCQLLTGKDDFIMTIIFDSGNNSEENIKLLISGAVCQVCLSCENGKLFVNSHYRLCFREFKGGRLKVERSIVC
jgi:hypothetical protein